jgi:hypothetical protein
MTETSTSELSDYELAGQPTSIDDLEQSTSQAVVDEFEKIERFEHAVRINDRENTFLVGRSPQANSDEYRLHHWPNSPASGIAGTIEHDRTLNFDGDDKHIIAFKPSGDGPNEETIVEEIQSLDVIKHDRTERLNNVLDEIRTELTESDWTGEDHTDTGYGEWISAVGEVADFIKEDEDSSYSFPPRVVMNSKIMHAIARYPLSSEELLSQTSDCIRDRVEGGFRTANPEALRTILLQYANE